MISQFQEWNKPLRKWQDYAFRDYLQFEDKNFLTVATPGAGKTTFALRIAHHLLSTQICERILIICPTSHLKEQWKWAAHAVGIDIDASFENSMGAGEASDYNGVVVTYHAIASLPQLHRNLCARKKTFVICDEIHHAGDDRTWGDALREAVEPAEKRLLLSGTPFRSDNSKIPFVRYENNISRADFNYGYGYALSDRVCRPVLFPSYEGHIEWVRSSGEIVKSRLTEDGTPSIEDERLRLALSAKGEWIKQVIADADNKLQQVRIKHRDAGGLIITMDQRHAREVAEIIENITGETPIIAVSDEPDSSDKIARFAGTGKHKGCAESKKRWIVAVKMVSEGVDIPRLRVAVYATTIATELFFRQAVGRVVRWINELGAEDQSAYFYIPADNVFIGFAQKIKEERDHQLQEELEQLEREEFADFDNEDIEEWRGSPTLISAEAEADSVIYDQSAFTQDEMLQAQEIMRAAGVPDSYEVTYFARALRISKGVAVNVQKESHVSHEPKQDRKKNYRDIVHRLVARLVIASNNAYKYEEVYTEMMKIQGVKQEKATEEQLKWRISYLKDTLQGYSNGSKLPRK